MKKILFIPFIVILTFSLSCKKQKEKEMSIQLAAEKMYLVEFTFHPLNPEEITKEDSIFRGFQVYGVSEIGRDFNRQVIYRGTIMDSLMINTELSDSSKIRINNVISTLKDSSLFPGINNNDMIYDGNYYFIALVKENGDTIFTDFLPKFLKNDLLFVYEEMYDKLIHTKDSKKIENYDSLDVSLKQKFITFIPDSSIQPLPKIIHKFIPPVIVADEKEIYLDIYSDINADY